jgi:hypothetical protein
VTYLPIISLWQPYASLIFAKLPGEAEFVKRHETRGFRPPVKYVGGYIGIHATAKFPAAKDIPEELHELCMDVFGCSYNHTLPRGAIIGAVRVSGGRPTESQKPASDEDRVSGDWAPGRFAWPLSDITPFAVPLPMKGKQGWWKFELPPGIGTGALSPADRGTP